MGPSRVSDSQPIWPKVELTPYSARTKTEVKCCKCCKTRLVAALESRLSVAPGAVSLELQQTQVPYYHAAAACLGPKQQRDVKEFALGWVCMNGGVGDSAQSVGLLRADQRPTTEPMSHVV